MINEKLGFDEAFDLIFEKMIEDIKSNSAVAKGVVTSQFGEAKEPLEISGSFDVYEKLDENGNYHFERSQYAPGITLELTLSILSPDDTYSAEVSSSGEGDGEWEDVHINEQYSITIKTQLFSKTTVEVNLHANTARNVEFHAHVDYSVIV